MRRILLSFFVIFTALTASVSAQSNETRQIFESGIVQAQAEKFEAALVDFKKSLALAETEDANAGFRARIHFNIGVCLYRTKRHFESVGEFEKAIRLSKGKYEKAFYALGMAQAELGDWQSAESAFRRALAINFGNGETWFDLAFVHLAQGEIADARLAFQKSIEHRSDDSAIAHNNLGVIFAVGGDLTAAVKEFEAAIKQSGGKFALAERNLQFCKSLGRNMNLTAKLEFGR